VGPDAVRPVRVKICGLRRREDVLAADASGADYLGVILSRGFGRSVDSGAATALVEGVRATLVAVLVDEPTGAAVERAEALGAGVIQLHGAEPSDAVRELAAEGRWRLWKSVRVRTADDVDRALDRYGDWVDGLLVEGWREGVVGGGGVRVDFRVLEGLRARLPKAMELILAGGLVPDNVADAVARFGPDIVDVSSGVEPEPGRKSHELIRRFITRARAAAPGPRHDEASTGEEGGEP
jgi:phosphoribosylanthranilate isomerase